MIIPTLLEVDWGCCKACLWHLFKVHFKHIHCIFKVTLLEVDWGCCKACLRQWRNRLGWAVHHLRNNYDKSL